MSRSVVLCPDPKIELSQTITDLTGITTEMVRTGSHPTVEFRILAHAIKEAPIVVGHNVPFDLGFLEAEFSWASELGALRRHGFWPVDFVCTRALSSFVFPGEKGHKLSDVARRLGINLEGAHRAINDLVATVEAFVKLCGPWLWQAAGRS